MSIQAYITLLWWPVVRWLIALLIVLVLPLNAETHRLGCHRWHSCPSDSGSYICGDTGNCSECPDNQYCKGGKPGTGTSAGGKAGKSLYVLGIELDIEKLFEDGDDFPLHEGFGEKPVVDVFLKKVLFLVGKH